MIAFLEPNLYHKLSYTGFILKIVSLKNSTILQQAKLTPDQFTNALLIEVNCTGKQMLSSELLHATNALYA
ncbi:hypothetical protein AK825_00600 [Psychrobacter sp. P11G5]|nr:hypothetical protein AK825_00600 [Psychrobacter sp. P11G5]